MRYIEEDENITREYEVRVNSEELQVIIDELNKKFYIVTSKNTLNVTGHNEEQAKEKIPCDDNTIVKIVGKKEVKDSYVEMANHTKTPYVFECEICRIKKSYLAQILEFTLKELTEERPLAKEVNNMITTLHNYVNSEEYKQVIKRINEPEKEGPAYFSEIRESADYELLIRLYEKALNCVELVLISEKTTFKKGSKVYKLGQRNVR